MTGRKVRVLHVLDSFDPGGAQEVVANLLSGCDGEHYEMEVASLHRPGVYTSRYKAMGVEVHSLSPHKYLPLYIPRLLWLFATRRYDIVHCHLTAANLIAKPLAALAGVPVIINHDHANDSAREKQKMLCWLDRMTNLLSSHVCAVSRSTRDFLIRKEGIPEEKVSLVYNGVDLQRFLPGQITREDARASYGLPTQGLCLAGIGRMTEQKNFALLLDAAAEVFKTHPDAFLLLAGNGPLEEKLRDQSARLGIENRIYFLGFVSNTAALYPAVDILVMPSLFEGLPIVLLEAMAMEVPVVASAVDGVAEILVDGTDGILVHGWESANFSQAISELLENPALRKELSAAARKKVTERCSSDAMCRSIEDTYQECLKKIVEEITPSHSGHAPCWMATLVKVHARLENFARRFGLFVLLGFALFYYSQYYRSGLNLGGEGGTVAVVAMRLMEGQRPMVDTFLGYNVMWFYPVVWLFKITGPNYIALRIYFFCICTASAVLGFLTLRRATGSAILAVFVGCLLIGIPGMIFRNYMPFLGLLNMYLLLQAYVFPQRTDRIRLIWMMASGVGLGLTFLFRVDLGIFFTVITAGLAVLYALGFYGPLKRRLIMAGSGCALAIGMIFLTHLPVYLDARAHGFDRNFTSQYCDWFGMIRNELKAKLHPVKQASPVAPTAAPIPAPAKHSVGNKESQTSVEMTDRSALKRRPLEEAFRNKKFYQQAFVLSLYLPIAISILVLFGGAIVLALALFRRNEAATLSVATLLTALGCALTLFPQYYFFRPDLPHLSEFMAPFLVVLGIAVWQAGRLLLLNGAWPVRMYCGLLISLCVTLGTVYVYHAAPKASAGTNDAAQGRTYELIADNGVHVLLKKEERDGLKSLYETVVAHSEPMDYVVCYPYAPTINLMTNRRSYEYNLYVDNATAPRKFQAEAVEKFQKFQPAVIVIDNRDINRSESSRFMNWAAPTYEYIKTHYRYAGTHFNQEVYVRPDKSTP